MLVALATHPGDRHLTVSLASHIRKLNCARGHDLLLVCPHGTNLAGIDDVFAQAFNRVHLFQYRETMRGWPWGANEAAYHVFTQIAVGNFGSHFLFLEPDCVLTSNRSLDELDFEYRRCGAQILGVTIPTVEMASKKEVGKHTVGVAIYPTNFLRICPLIKSLIAATGTYRAANTPYPWDAMFGPYTGRMTAQTNSIQHLQRRVFQNSGGMLWDCPSLENALQQVNRNALLVHGCKHPEFIDRLTGGTPNAAQERQGPNFSQHQGNAQGANGGEDRSETRQSESKAGSDSSSHRSIPKVTAAKTKEQIKEEKRLERARVKRLADLTKLKAEWHIEFEIDTPEWKRATEIYVDDKVRYPELKSYARELSIKAERNWKKGELICAIVKAEREQGKQPWAAALKPEIPVEVPSTPSSEPSLIIDPSVRVAPSQSSKVLFESESLVGVARAENRGVEAGPCIAQIIPLGSMASPRNSPKNGMSIDRTQQMMNLRMNRMARGLPT